MEYVSLTAQEHSFWLSEQVSSKHNHTAVAFDIGMNHDSERLGEALRLLVAGQLRLHSKIVTRQGEPCWQVVAEDDYPLLSVSTCDDDTMDAAFADFAHRGFRLDTECLCRFGLLRGTHRQLLMMVLHHAVSEVHTVALLCERLSQLYNILADGSLAPEAVPLQPLSSPATSAADIAYWRDYVGQHAADPLQPYFPPSMQAGAITTCQFTFGALAAQLSDLCQREGVGPFRLLAAAWGAVLLKVFGTNGLWLNYPVSLRTDEERDVMATFVADQVLHVGCDTTTTFRQLVDGVTADRRQARPHQHASLLQTAVGDVLRQEHASALFNYPLDRRNYVLTLDGERIPLYKDLTTYMPCGLQLDIEEDLSFGIVYANEQYPDFFARMLADAFVCVLGQVTTHYDMALSELLLCQQRDTYNRQVEPVAEADTSLAARFVRTARRHADAIAVVCQGQKATYGQIDQWSDAVARLVLQTVADGDSPFVGIFIGRNIYTPAVLMGVWKAGRAYIPLDPENPAERMSFILADSQLGCILCQRDLLPQLRAMSLPKDVAIVCYDDVIATSDGAVLTPCSTDALAYMMYTSGTTGNPKGAPIRQTSVAGFIDACADYAPLAPGDRQLCFNSIAFDLSVWDMFCPLMAGATVVMATEAERRDPRLLFELAQKQRVTHAILAPAMLSCVDYRPMPHLRYLVLSGEASPLDTVRRWLPVGTVLNGYGPTENTIVCNIHVYRPDDDCATNIGPGLRGTTGYVLDAQHHLLPPGVKGEFFVGGRQLTTGYHHRPELNAERFMPNPFASDAERQQGLNDRLYATGDVAYRLPSGDVIYCGRRDSQVKINGHRIELGEIAARIEQFADVSIAAVMVVERNGTRQLHAFVETASGTLDRRALRAWLERHLPLFMLPTAYTLVGRMPMNVNRKVDTRALKALLESGDADVQTDDWQDSIYAEIDLQGGELMATRRALADIWVELLGGNDRFALTDNFLALGGSSISIIVMVQRIEQRLGASIAVADVYREATIERLAGLVGQVAQRMPLSDTLGVKARMAAPPHLQSLLLQCTISSEAAKAYNLAVTLPVPDEADDALMLQAWNLLRQMQDALRLGVSIGTGGKPFMQVAPYEPCAAIMSQAYTDDTDLKQLIREQIAHPWPFDGTPLCRLLLFCQQGGGDRSLILFIHHLATDGWSLALACRQYGEICRSLLDHQPERMPLPLHTYREYCEEMNAQPAAQACRDFWTDYLAEFEDIRLPYIASADGADRGAAIIEQPLPDAMAAEVQAYCEQHELTPFAFYASAYMLMLARLCRQTGFVVGYPLAGRSDARYADVMGYFVHPMPLRFVAAAWEKTFVQLCRHTMSDVQQAGRYMTDFAQLVELANQQGYTDPTVPLIQAMFTLDTLSADRVMDNAHLAQFPLTLTITAHADGSWTSAWKYATGRLGADSVGLMARCYVTLIGHILQQPDVAVARLSMVSADERSKLLARNTIWPLAIPHDETIVSLFRQQVARNPHPWMIKDKLTTMSYAEVDRRSDLVAGAVGSMAYEPYKPYEPHRPHTPHEPQPVTGLYMQRSAQAVVAMIGIMKAGHMYVPLDTTYPPERIRTMVDDSQMGCVICQRSLFEQLRAMQLPERVSIVCYEDAIASSSSPVNPVYPLQPDTPACNVPVYPLQPDTPAYMIYTSGTTGQPKGVVITHGNVVALARIGGQGVCNPVADDIVLQFNSYIFDASINDIFASLLNGARLVCVDEEGRRDPDLLFEQMEQDGVTYACIPPALLQNSGKEPTTSLRTLLCGGETPTEQVVERYTRKGVMLNGYGPSENTVVATVNNYRQSGIYTANCIGRQLPGVSCYVLDDHLNLVPPGCPGQLFLGGLQLSTGYHNRPELNREHFIENPYVSPDDEAHRQNLRLYATGDVVTQDADGNFYFIGRKDFQVKLRGHRVELSEIESTLLRHLSVRMCVVMVVKRGVTDQLAAYVACDGERPSLQQLRDFVADALPAYMVPTYWYVATELPLTVNGKIDRRRLNDLPLDTVATTDANGTQSEEEKKCRSIVARIMTVEAESIGVDEDLISELGMNSLFVLELVHQLTTRGYDVHPMDIYNLRSIRRIVHYMGSGQHLTDEQIDRRLCYLATPDDPAKPLLLVVCGYRYYEVNYTDLHNALKDRYTLLVLESAIELQSYRPQCAATADAMLDEYVRLLRPYIAQRPIAGITGLCIGGDIGLELAIRLDQQGLCRPAVFVIDGMADRPAYRGNTGIMEGAGISQETDHQRKDYIISFSKTLHQHRYDGRAYLFMATQFESVEKFTEQEARDFFPVNRDNWQRLQPGIIISYYDCVHMQLIHQPETLRQMRQIIDAELLADKTN